MMRRQWYFLLAVIVMGFALLSSMALPVRGASPIYVDDSAAGNNDGSDWQNAFVSLKDALAVATSGDEIWVAEGVYYPDVSGGVDSNDRAASFQIGLGVAIYGGFPGAGSALDDRDPAQHPTILSGDIGQDDLGPDVLTDTTKVVGDNSYHVVNASGATQDDVLDGFIITAGKADGTWVSPCGPLCGGGLYANQGSPILKNLVFSGNQAAVNGSGGGAFFYQGSPTMEFVQFNFNKAPNGGGLHLETGSPSLDNVQFYRNYAPSQGGGATLFQTNPTFNQVLFHQNEAEYNAGGMYSFNSNLQFTDVTFLNNRCRQQTAGGMGIYGGNSHLEEMEFTRNQAGTKGGGLYVNQAQVEIVRGWFEKNLAYDGAGVYNEKGALTMNSINLYGNIANHYGGGLFGLQDTTVLENVAFQENEATEEGGGARMSFSQLSIHHSQFLGNHSGNAGGMYTNMGTTILHNVAAVGNAGTYSGAFNFAGGIQVLTNVSASANFSTYDGAGMYLWAGSDTLIQNSIFYGDVNEVYISGVTPVFSNTIVKGGCPAGATCSNVTGDNPLFNEAPNPGDGDWATPADNDYGDLSLQEGSPAIDASDNAADLDGAGAGTKTAAEVELDAALKKRLVDGDENGTAIIDLGAYEYQVQKIYLPLITR